MEGGLRQGWETRAAVEEMINKEELRQKRARTASRRAAWWRVATVVVALSALLGWILVAWKGM
jgi:CHASE3 domain sensor protein